MNDSDLDRQLRSAGVPERDANYWENFPSQVLVTLLAPHRPAEPPPTLMFPRLAWAAIVATACVALSIAFTDGGASSRTTAPVAWLKNQTALREVLTLFPNRVQAIVQDERGVQLVLSEQADVPTSPALWIEFEEHGHRGTAVTFSGQQIEIAGERVEVLANPQGQITLIGERIFWSSVLPGRSTDGVRVRAEELAAVL
jgi:hypothetical protein